MKENVSGRMFEHEIDEEFEIHNAIMKNKSVEKYSVRTLYTPT